MKFVIIIVDGKIEVRGDVEYVWKVCEDSLECFQLDYIDLYYQYRVDIKVFIEVMVFIFFVCFFVIVMF